MLQYDDPANQQLTGSALAVSSVADLLSQPQLPAGLATAISDFDSLLAELNKEDGSEPDSVNGKDVYGQNGNRDARCVEMSQKVAAEPDIFTPFQFNLQYNDTDPLAASIAPYHAVPVLSIPTATEAGPAVIQITALPQILSQASFPNPWEQPEPPAEAACQTAAEEEVASAASETASSGGESAASTRLPADLDEKTEYMKAVLGRYEKIVKANTCNGKTQVHQVVLFLLLATISPHVKMDFSGILTFCDETGKATQKTGRLFKTINTKAMGLIWQKIKGNRNGNYDTFARAMRVGRERKKDYFVYLEFGKGTKKKIYQLGDKSYGDIRRMEELLSEIC